ncbi:TPA: hypothetical protein GFY71_24355 [Escherichia coli]|nr:hypothetical protein BEJ66_26505 [Escherichia coli]HAH2654689.1 hypothetical protein [Escherichia coli]
MYWLYLAPILEFSHQKTLTKNNEKTKLPPSTHRTVFSANSSATPALRGNRGFLSGRSQTSEWKASRDRQRSSNGALY